MYQGFAYVSKFGILKTSEYTPYHESAGKCNGGRNATDLTTHMKDIGYVEHDR